jgi:RNA polymerase sigma-70 factor, ECF subfamily
MRDMRSDDAAVEARPVDGRTRAFREELVAEMPNLRAFAISLSGQLQLADDLVQETLLKAWSNADSYQPGSNLRAWLFTILRNTYFSLYRHRGREVQDSDGVYSQRLATPAAQEGALDLADFRIALAKLPPEQREVLIMVGASGLSYEEAAAVCNIAIGTVKSRVSRARAKLAELLGISGPEDLLHTPTADAAAKSGGATEGS